jgi:hypothetical protein
MIYYLQNYRVNRRLTSGEKASGMMTSGQQNTTRINGFPVDIFNIIQIMTHSFYSRIALFPWEASSSKQIY